MHFFALQFEGPAGISDVVFNGDDGQLVGGYIAIDGVGVGFHTALGAAGQQQR